MSWHAYKVIWFIAIYVATVGILSIAIGLKAFSRGEKWAWYSIAAFVLEC